MDLPGAGARGNRGARLMPITSVKLLPGVTTDVTPVANEAGIQASNLIRFREYAQQGVFAEKVGGWTKFYSLSYTSAPRALHAWQGLKGDQYLGVGTTAQLAVIASGKSKDITPQKTTTTPAVALSTTSGSAVVTVTDAGTNMTVYDVAVFNTPIAVGGLIINGSYKVTAALGANSYQITAATNATSTVTSGGAVPTFTTTSGSFQVTVTLNNHGYAVGSTATIPVSTTGNGVTIYGTYTLFSATTNTFVITASTTATASGTFSMNGGLAKIDHWIGVGPAISSAGYGTGGYGVGGYSTGAAAPTRTGTPITTTGWSLDNWGENLVACAEGGPVFIWDPDNVFRTATILANAPALNTGAFVAMPQQQIVTYGASVAGFQDPLMVAWSDVSNYDVWTASSINQAGTYRIPTGSKIIGGLQAPNQSLFWTDLSVWSMQYIGPPLVYGFNMLANGCGLIGRQAVTLAGNTAFWMSQSQFFRVQGGDVQPIACPVWDVVFQNLNRAYASKIRAGANSRFNEVWWFYPSSSATENDSYVKYNYVLNTWDYGSLARTAWIDQSVLGAPIGASPTGFVYQHESGYDNDGAPNSAFIQTGWFSLADGDVMAFVDWMMPDMRWGTYSGTQAAAVQITIEVANYPGDTPLTLGPYTIQQATQYVNTRLRGRLVRMKIASVDTGSFWRVGRIRYRIAQDGKVGGP